MLRTVRGMWRWWLLRAQTNGWISQLSKKLTTILAHSNFLRVLVLSSILHQSVTFLDSGVSFTLGWPRKAQRGGTLQTILVGKLSEILLYPAMLGLLHLHNEKNFLSISQVVSSQNLPLTDLWSVEWSFFYYNLWIARGIALVIPRSNYNYKSKQRMVSNFYNHISLFWREIFVQLLGLFEACRERTRYLAK